MFLRTESLRVGGAGRGRRGQFVFPFVSVVVRKVRVAGKTQTHLEECRSRRLVAMNWQSMSHFRRQTKWCSFVTNYTTKDVLGVDSVDYLLYFKRNRRTLSWILLYYDFLSVLTGWCSQRGEMGEDTRAINQKSIRQTFRFQRNQITRTNKLKSKVTDSRLLVSWFLSMIKH